MKNMFLKSALVFCLCMVTVSAANAQAALLALIFGDNVASEKFHLSNELPRGRAPRYQMKFLSKCQLIIN
jgi:hypothetical protein